MSPDLLLANLLNYSWQLVALIGLGIALPVVCRLREPRSHLIYLQGLLLAAMLLPVLQPWIQPVSLGGSLVYSSTTVSTGGSVTDGTGASWPEALLIVMLIGTAARLAWLSLGLWRLRSYRRNARPVHFAAISEAHRATLTAARVAESSAVPGPVTFGYLQPLVLLPPTVQALEREAQFAVVAHELLHVKRADWLHVLAEELITAVLWWHPAIWVLVARIRLTREQVIDRAVVELTASPQPYVEALLTLADHAPRPALAPNFLRRRQLAVRIQTLLCEVTMSRTRLVTTYSLVTALALATAYLSTTAFPLQAAPQFTEGNSNGVTGAEVVLRRAPAYPSLAKRQGIEGTVVVEATIADNGSVADARVLSGPQELRRAALESVLQWQFKNGRVAQVSLNFSLLKETVPAAIGGKLGNVNIRDASPALAETLTARLAHLEGQPVNAREISEIVSAVAPGFTTAFVTNEATQQVTLTIAKAASDFKATPDFGKADGPRIRIGGNVQATKLINKVIPTYPSQAKVERIQGKVRFAALIAADGRVKNLMLESGHPLLVESAVTAVRQWAYQPTLLNGNPVEVVTAIDVNYTLAP